MLFYKKFDTVNYLRYNFFTLADRTIAPCANVGRKVRTLVVLLLRADKYVAGNPRLEQLNNSNIIWPSHEMRTETPIIREDLGTHKVSLTRAFRTFRFVQEPVNFRVKLEVYLNTQRTDGEN